MVYLQSSTECDDAKTALNKIRRENELLCEENRTLRRHNDHLRTQAEKVEREALGMREQRPQAARDEVAAQLMAENVRLKAECTRFIAGGQEPNGESIGESPR